jgi:hypothetical protein
VIVMVVAEEQPREAPAVRAQAVDGMAETRARCGVGRRRIDDHGVTAADEHVVGRGRRGQRRGRQGEANDARLDPLRVAGGRDCALGGVGGRGGG